MKNILEDSLREAMAFAGVQEMPKEYDGNGVWAKAIVQVRSTTGVRHYAVAKQHNGKPDFLATFYEGGVIVLVEHIYPFLVVANRTADKYPTRQDKIKALAASGYYGEAENAAKALFKLNVEQLNTLFDNADIKDAIAKEFIDERIAAVQIDENF